MIYRLIRSSMRKITIITKEKLIMSLLKHLYLKLVVSDLFIKIITFTAFWEPTKEPSIQLC